MLFLLHGSVDRYYCFDCNGSGAGELELLSGYTNTKLHISLPIITAVTIEQNLESCMTNVHYVL